MHQYELSKHFRFESAHRLAKGYKGKCANVHGHSWNGTLTVIVTTMDQYGMAFDFSELGAFLKDIEGWLDHKTLVWIGDKPLIQYLKDNGQSYVEFMDNPTCEVIARDLYNLAVEHFRKNPYVKIDSVTINETCTTACVYRNTKENEKQSES